MTIYIYIKIYIKISCLKVFSGIYKRHKGLLSKVCFECHVSQNDNEELSVLEVDAEWCMEVFLNATHYIRHKTIDLFIQQLYYAINLTSQSHQPQGQSVTRDLRA